MEKYPNVIGGSPDDLNAPLVVKNKCITDAYGIITFEKPRGFVFEPGNWMDIRFLSADLAIGKTFSITSSPTEPDIMIAFKKGISKFKKALEQIQIGDTMLITQFGSNGFLLDKRYESVFIAGGIGITPFRSMIKEAIDANSKVEITLIYQNHTDDFPFREELEEWQPIFPSLKIQYVVTGKEARLSKDKLERLVPDVANKMIHIVGSPSMVENVEKMLLILGTKKEYIKIDSFDGY